MKDSIALLIITLICKLTERKVLGLATFVDPPSGSVIANFEGTLNASTLTCYVTNNDGSMGSTAWFILNFRGSSGLQLITDDFVTEIFSVGGDPRPNDPTRTFRNQLTIVNFTVELDRVALYCGTGSNREQANFFLRIYRPPMIQDNIMLKVEENSGRIPVNLSEGLAAFPDPNFQWTKDGEPLNGPALTYNSVTFDNITREDAGNYTVLATNFLLNSTTEVVGNDIGSFYLDILYGPSFSSDGPTQTLTRRYALLGDHFSLICGTGLDSNPQATITWTAPDGTTIVDNARYDLEDGPDIVRLNFTHTILSDSGVWICEIVVRSERHVVSSQGELILRGQAVIGTPLRHQFMLTAIVPPGQPRALSVQNIGATWVLIHWESPTDVNFPISHYEIVGASAAGGVRLSTPDNNTFINVTGLDSGTTYNFSVFAVIQAGDVVARSEESAPLEDIGTANIIIIESPSLPCHVAVVGGILGSLLAISLFINIILVILLVLTFRSIAKSLAATNEATYEYPEMSVKSTDPKMESCAAYGVVNTGHL